MAKFVLVLKGSPRLLGNSAILADQTARGAQEAGAQVESFYLHGLRIQPCDACEACHLGEEGCIIADDMQMLYPKLRQADAIVLATPIYWFSLSAQLKLCIDRWYALETSQGNQLAGKKFGLIFVYGDSDPFKSGAVNAMRTFQDMTAYLGARIVGMVHGSAGEAGEIKEQPALLERAYRLGKELVSDE